MKERGGFGDWLNVAWDDRVAVNLLATDPFARIDAPSETGWRLLRAAAVADVRREEVRAAPPPPRWKRPSPRPEVCRHRLRRRPGRTDFAISTKLP